MVIKSCIFTALLRLFSYFLGIPLFLCSVSYLFCLILPSSVSLCILLWYILLLYFQCLFLSHHAAVIPISHNHPIPSHYTHPIVASLPLAVLTSQLSNKERSLSCVFDILFCDTLGSPNCAVNDDIGLQVSAMGTLITTIIKNNSKGDCLGTCLFFFL